ncbi:MAG: ATP-dependent zinc metalloprotease FtsH [Clostridium sp.]|uniref:ATP-dependent zinc metalloprotease FtsH n=1 Tax=Clostridium sp. TaxID=1506 RepID=UPI00290739B9|nr:ATP-dependent zinc metalloprotease FtsH [Clostridium sp.]MDU7338227.1 ATP-dependent zinc metalloprotease FtsH [Clostridium sp.]
MDNKKNLRNLIIYLGAPILIIIIMASIYGNVKPQKAHKYSEIVGYFKSQQVTDYSMDLGSGEMQISLKDGTKVTYTAPNVGIMYEEIHPYIQQYNEDHPDKNMEYDLKRPAETSWLASLIPTILLLAGMLVFWWFMMKRLNTSMGDAGKQMNFGKAKVKQMADEKRKTTFADVAGADEEKEELREIVEFLKNPKKYNELGARIPKGVLLVGPPGTGKTLLARAVAGEAGVPFFSISGSDFVEMFVGVGASRVRDLFDQAKKNSPCIIFIDEIDAVGRQRGAGLGGGHDEREQTLNQLLVEMDGFGANEGVIMIAATNRPDILDPALMRPGRFDRQVMVGYPDIKGREEILKVHARGKPIAPNVSLKTIAKSTAGFTGADLENLLNEAALLSARKNLRAITMEEIEEATIKVVVGTEKKSRVMTEKEKTLTAYHEGGHAVVTYFCSTQDPVHQISIIPRGMAGGYTMQLPSEDRSYKCKKEMLEDLMVLMGGRVAESLVLDDISTGASNDIERATKTARAMITKYGMSEMLGTVTYGSDSSEPFLGRDMGHVRNYSESTAAAIDAEIKDILTNAYDKAAKILSDHMDKLHLVAKYLYQNEKMSGEDFQKLMSGAVLPGITDQVPVLETSEERTLADSKPEEETAE